MLTFFPPIAIAVVIAIIAGLVLRKVAERLRVRRVATLQAIHAVMEPYRRGDYETALRGAESFRRGGQLTAPCCFYRGANLGHLGRLEEGEVWLRRNIGMRVKKTRSAIWRSATAVSDT